MSTVLSSQSTGEDAPTVLNLVTSETARFFREQRDELRRQGVDSETIAVPRPEEGLRSPLDYARFGRTVLDHGTAEFDLVHANFGLTAPVALAATTLRTQRPVVLSLWGSDVHGPVGHLSRASARFVDATIVMSEGMADRLGRECHVIPHGVNVEKFYPRDRATARGELGWPDDRYHVLFPYDTSRDVKNYPRAKRLAASAEELLDRPVAIQAVSGVAHEDMNAYYNAADALLLTSRREGSPNAVKEALAANVPVVSTDVGDVAERLEGVRPSFVGDKDEELTASLVRLLRGDERSNGREVVAEECSADQMGRRIREVYRRVL